MKLACCLFLFAFLNISANANTEKAIFIGPRAIGSVESLNDLQLTTLTPATPCLRTSLPVSFPKGTTKAERNRQGEQSWYILNNLNSGQRYELRVCWAAIQPTNFWIDVFEPDEIIQDYRLLHDVTEFSQQVSSKQQTTKLVRDSSTLLLRVIAAADFFSSNKTLMVHPPPVDVDIILDPYLANVFPASLVPTAGYIIILAIVSWFLSGIIWRRLSQQAQPSKAHED